MFRTSIAAPAQLSVEQVAEICSVNTKTVRRWIAAGLLPAYRLGDKLIRIDPADLEQFSRRIPAAGA